jgi:hypothetical protein
MRGTGLFLLALLLPANARADTWKCTLLESHHFVNGRDVAQKGGGDYRLEVKPPVINLMANGHFIIGYRIIENSRFRLFGEKQTDLGGGERRIARITLDKVHGRAGHSGFSNKGDSEELREVTSGRCSEAP